MLSSRRFFGKRNVRYFRLKSPCQPNEWNAMFTYRFFHTNDFR